MKKTIILFSLLALFACSKDDSSNAQQENPVDFYACGGAKTGISDEKAVYWKNGQPTFLTTQAGYANAMDVSNGNVYIVGEDNGVAKYWKNGIDQQLTSILNYYVTDICVSNNDVYIVGSTYSTIKYWKNGVQYDVASYTNGNLYAAGIKVIDNDVYIAFIENGVIKLWKNGVVTILSNGNSVDYIKNLDVYNSDVYVLAEENFNGGKKIKYWKNGTPNYLNTTGNNIVGYHIKVNTNGVVVGGTYNNKAGYWKNNIFYDLSTAGNNSFNYATNILDENVYNAITDNGIAKFYKNTTKIYQDNSVSEPNFNDCIVLYK